MNIFFVDYNPIRAAQSLCDKHIPKMVVESIQLLSIAHHRYTTAYVPHVYKTTHEHHPCAQWVCASKGNYVWLVAHTEALLHEYQFRFGDSKKHRHAGWGLFPWVRHIPPIPSAYPTLPALAMPEQFKCADPVESYRAYYRGEKARFAKWERGRPPPSWW